MSGYQLLVLNVGLYSALPFYFATLREPLRAVSFYVYIALILLLGGLFGAVYALPITDTLSIAGGSINYAAMMMCILLLVMTEGSEDVLKSVLRLVVVVNLFVLSTYSLLGFILESPVTINPLAVSSRVFQTSIPTLIVGEVLILSELLLLIWFGERFKLAIAKPLVLGVAYVALFMAVLCLDGILFPLLFFPFDSSLPGIVIGNLQSKAVLAGMFGLPMLLYLSVFRRLLERFRRVPLRLSELLNIGADSSVRSAERKSALSKLDNTELRQLAERLSMANQAASMGIWEYDTETESFDVDDRTRTILCLDPSESGTTAGEWWAMIYPEDWPLLQRCNEALASGEVDSETVTYRLKSEVDPAGQVKFVKSQMMVDRSGTSLRILGAISDVTAETQLIDENRRMQAQLRQSQKMEALGRFAGSIAHDFNNLLTPIMGHADLARSKLPADSPVAGDLDEVLGAADRSRKLIGQILTLGNDSTPARSKLNLGDVITEFSSMLRSALGSGMLLTLDLNGSAEVMANRGQLEQVLLNLATNSRDATSGTGQLTITTEVVDTSDQPRSVRQEIADGRYICLSVRDDGPGMDETTLERAFEPFYTTKGGARGTGLGMFSIYTIIQQHSGYVWIDSTPNLGTTVWILLPLYEPE